MRIIEVRNKLDAVHEGTDSRLHTLLAHRTGVQARPSDSLPIDCGHWSQEWWGFNSSSTFNKLSDDIRREIVETCNRDLLKESYFIEKSGLAYSAKMILLAQDTDTAQLYAFIAADEARHLARVEPYLTAEEKVKPNGEFLAFLSQLVEEASPRLLVFLVQIILEGWGLDHYKRLSMGCTDSSLADIFRSILKDEALHHRSGEVLFDGQRLFQDELQMVETGLCRYAEMVRPGPLTAVGIADRAAGGFSALEVEDLLQALRHQSESLRKLNLLKSLMLRPGIETIVDRMEQANYFAPMPVPEAARAYLAMR